MSNSFGDLLRLNTAIFHALGDSARQDIILLLDKYKRMHVNEITEHSPLSRPAISHHLKILREAGIVGISREGTKRYYYVTIQHNIHLLKDLILEIETHCND